MEDKDKTKEQLIEELGKLRKKVTGLEKSESEHKKEEEILFNKEIMENMLEGVYIVGLEDVIIKYANPKFEKIFGYEPGEMLGKHASIVNAFTDMDPLDKAKEIMDTIYETGKWHGEVNNIKKDGTPFWCYANVSIFDHAKYGKVVVAVHSDITERKRLEKELILKSEIIINMSEGVYLIQADDGIIVYTNPKFEEIFGYREGELLGKHVSILNAPTEKSPEETAKEIIEIINKKGMWKGEIKNIKKDGTIFWSFASVSSFDHPEFGSVWAVIHSDITERKQAEEKLRESEEKYRGFMDEAPDSFVLFDSKLNYVDVNKTALKYVPSGTKKEHIIGKNLADLIPSTKESGRYDKYLDVIKTGEPFISDDILADPILGSSFFIFKAFKLGQGLGVISQDITKRKKAEEEIKHSQEELQKLAAHMQFATEQERGLIASELHDEIGQALVCLKLDIATIINKMSKEKIEIPIQFQNMEKLLDDTLEKLGKIYSDLRPSLLEHFGIGGAMRQYVSDFQKQSGTKFTLYQNPEEIILEENRSIALYRIFQGALNNIKWHSKATKANIRLVEKGPNLKLTIKDNGIGIKEEQIKRSDSFGLIGMRERARYLGGELKITGIPDKGTTIMLTIPIKKI